MFLGERSSRVLVGKLQVNDCDLCIACYHQKGIEQTHHSLKLDVASLRPFAAWMMKIGCAMVSAISFEGAEHVANMTVYNGFFWSTCQVSSISRYQRQKSHSFSTLQGGGQEGP